MNSFFQDLRFGARMLMKNPGFTLIAVLTLAVGIGANTAIFSLVYAVLFKPLPYHDPARLVMVWEEASFAGFPENTPSPANYVDWKSQSKLFEGMAALDIRTFNLTADGEPEQLQAYGVTADFFPLLGVKPVEGRVFLSDEDKPGANRVVIISHRLWQRRYGGERSIIGKKILLNDEQYQVVGVTPAGFQFMEPFINLWVPIGFTQEELALRGDHYLQVVGRLKPGVEVAQADAEIKTIMQRISRDYPNEAGKLGAYVKSLREQFAGDSRKPLIMLLVAVGFVLLIACANIANLLLARAVSRKREIAVRMALGASRGRIVRQLIAENLLLAGCGAAFGVLLALWSFVFLKKLIPATMSISTDLTLDWRAIGFAAVISIMTGLIFGAAPALQASGENLNDSLKSSSSRAVGDGSSHRLRNLLVIGEIAMALALLAGAGLMIRTLWNLNRQYSGFNPDQLLIVRTKLPEKKYEEHGARTAFYDQTLERVRALPGVTAAGYTTSAPLAWKGGSTGIAVEGKLPEPGEFNDAIHRQVSEGYLSALGVPLRAGRHFNQFDTLESAPVAIVNETLARQEWPGEDPIGKRFKLGAVSSKRPWITVVGVASDVRQMGVDVAVKAELYLPYRQTNYFQWYSPRDLIVRSTGDPTDLTDSIRRAVQSIDPNQPISSVMTMEELLGEETVTRRLGMILLMAFAAIALLLSALGIYGALSYFVTQRTSEIGVRLALGAQPQDVLRLVLGKGMTLALIGTAAGLAAALALTRLMRSFLFEIKTTDPMTFIAVAGALLIVALAACLLPAFRASRLDPMIALRQE